MDERKLEDIARKITISAHGDNYDHSQYAKILNCLHDFNKFLENFDTNLNKVLESIDAYLKGL